MRRYITKKQRIDHALSLHGGLKAVVMARYERGERMQDIAEVIGVLAKIPVDFTTLYIWVRQWRAEDEKAIREEVGA